MIKTACLSSQYMLYLGTSATWYIWYRYENTEVGRQDLLLCFYIYTITRLSMRISFCDVMNWAMVDTSLSLQGSGKWYLFTKGEYVCYLVWFVKEYITFTRTSQFGLQPHRINNTRRIATRCITSVATSKVSILLFQTRIYYVCCRPFLLKV